MLTSLNLSENWVPELGICMAEALKVNSALTELYLANNQIGDTGLKSLSDALSSGALEKLEQLGLGGNQIGDKGLESLSGALSNGAMEKLVAISVDNTNHPQLKAACSKRGVKMH